MNSRQDWTKTVLPLIVLFLAFIPLLLVKPAARPAIGGTPDCEASQSLLPVIEPKHIPAIGIVIQPPPPGTSPVLSADQAFQRACQEEGTPSNVVEASFVLFGGAAPYLAIQDEVAVDLAPQDELLIPAWIVSYKGACIPDFGHSDVTAEEGCSPNEEFNVVIDSTTGGFIMAYSWDPTATES